MWERREENSMCWWWPRIKHTAVLKPATEIIDAGDELLEFFWVLMGCFEGEAKGDTVAEPQEPAWMDDVLVAADALGYPVFMRTDLASGKHDWKSTCFVPDRNAVHRNFFSLIEENVNADIVGLPCRALVIREYIEPAATFTAFWGEMPVGRERRYFVRDGIVECHHPYWPEEAIHNPSRDDWREQLALLNRESEDEKAFLADCAEQLAQCLPGYWSLDFMQGADGKWWFIDAALGNDSWHPVCECVQEWS